MPSILRKRKSQHKVSESSPLRPSLSLPDITSPLLDTSAWEWDEVPSSFPAHPGPGTGNPSRNRAPSLIKDPNSPVQFHRPFTPWQLVAGGNGNAPPGDFRNTAAWRASAVESRASVFDGRKRAKARAKALESLNVVVAGGRGVGKTSFIRLLLGSMDDQASTPPSPVKAQISEGQTASSPTSAGPPITSPSAPQAISESPQAQNEVGPTKRLSSKVITASVEQYDTVKLRVIDTPGLDLCEDPVSSKARERGVAGLLRLLEEQFEQTLREESRIVRSKKRQEDGMVHLVLYLIDARSVLSPAKGYGEEEEVDWSCVGLFDDGSPSELELHYEARRAEARVDINAIATIRRLSTRANVLPILSHVDSLTLAELSTARKVLRRDLGKVFAVEEGAGFGIFGQAEDDQDTGGETPELSSGSGSDTDRPLTPASLGSGQNPQLPYCVFAPEGGGRTRVYGWGEADVMDPSQSDFTRLREAILGQFANTLRSSTKERLYETYRTERLMSKRS